MGTRTLDPNPKRQEKINQPDARRHFQLSMIKSAVRIAAGIAMVLPQSIMLAGAFLILAEIVGVAEEMV